MEGIFGSVPVWVWAAVGYVVLAVIISLVARLFFGSAVGWKTYEIAGWPAGTVFSILAFVPRCLRNQRRRQVFQNIFVCRWDRDDIDAMQKRVDSVLSNLAVAMQSGFDIESRAYTARRRIPAQVAAAEHYAKQCKRDFWRAHGVAAKMGLNVRGSYKDYLPPR